MAQIITQETRELVLPADAFEVTREVVYRGPKRFATFSGGRWLEHTDQLSALGAIREDVAKTVSYPTVVTIRWQIPADIQAPSTGRHLP